MIASRLALGLAAMMVAACERQSPPVNAQEQRPLTIATPEADPNAIQPTDCALPSLALAESAKKLSNKIVAETKANFSTAFGRSCVNGTLESGEFYDPEAADPGRLFLFNAPDANVASIYTSKVNGNRMVLEYPFLTADGQSRVPTIEELEEAIYCSVVGATPKEQEDSGRCLPD